MHVRSLVYVPIHHQKKIIYEKFLPEKGYKEVISSFFWWWTEA